MARIVTSLPQSRFEQYHIDIPSDWEMIYIQPTEESFASAIKGTDILWVSSMDTVSTAVIEASDQLKMIHTQGVGFNKQQSCQQFVCGRTYPGNDPEFSSRDSVSEQGM